MKTARILVVDDEPGIRQSLCGVLGDEGYQARAVASGEACLQDLLARALPSWSCWTSGCRASTAWRR